MLRNFPLPEYELSPPDTRLFHRDPYIRMRGDQLEPGRQRELGATKKHGPYRLDILVRLAIGRE